MELHPILEPGLCPRSGLWYVISPSGSAPTLRVGHSATFVSQSASTGTGDDQTATQGKVYLLCGANPDATFADVNVLDLTELSWKQLPSLCRTGRYEHSVSLALDGKIFVFGGATKSGSLNDVQCFDTESQSWTPPIEVGGKLPSPRTYHSACSTGNGFLIVYSGGHAAAEPVTDRQVHLFNPETKVWSTIPTSGNSPKPRHGHLALYLPASPMKDSKSHGSLYIHGGMAGMTFYDDLHQLTFSGDNYRSGDWQEVKIGGGRRGRDSIPCARASHGGVVFRETLVIFGGVNKQSALDDMHQFDTLTRQWTQIKYTGPPPPSRLDFASCLISLKVSSTVNSHPGADGDLVNASSEDNYVVITNKDDDTNDAANCESQAISEGVGRLCHLLLIHGGMDTLGEVFDDTLVFLLAEEASSEVIQSRVEMVNDIVTVNDEAGVSVPPNSSPCNIVTLVDACNLTETDNVHGTE